MHKPEEAGATFTRARSDFLPATTTMNRTKISKSAAPSGASVPHSSLQDRLSRLYTVAQDADYVFGSPLGPLAGATLALPRFVYFGPQTSEVSPRLSVLSGLGRHDALAARALLAFIERLARSPEIGHALNIAFFPVANASALLGDTEDNDLGRETWTDAHTPELRLLAQDARQRQYQGFIRVVTTADDEPSAWVRTIDSHFAERSTADVFDSRDFEPWQVGFATLSATAAVRGPLSLAHDLPFPPFDVELAIPADWSQAHADTQLAAILKRLITHYRGFIAYGQHL